MDYMEATYLGSEQQSEPLELCGYGGPNYASGLTKLCRNKAKLRYIMQHYL